MHPVNFLKHDTAVIDAGCIIGAGTQVWHFSHLMKGCIVGSKCNIGQNVFIGKDVVLGNNVKVQNNVSIYTGVTCGDDVFLGPSMVFTNVINPRSAIDRKNQLKKTVVKRGASIGANATIVCGNTLGEYCMVGAGSVITKPVKPYALMIGNPALQKGWVSEYGHTLSFSTAGIAVCPESGEAYRLENETVTKITGSIKAI